jgi:hypothetical protein
MTSLEKVREFMETADGTEHGLSALRELAEKHRDRIGEEAQPEALDLVAPEKQWAILMASEIGQMHAYLDKNGSEHVYAVAEDAYEEQDSYRPTHLVDDQSYPDIADSGPTDVEIEFGFSGGSVDDA